MNKEIEIKLAKKNGNIDKLYSQMVIERIRERYSQSEENAILRKKLANLDYKNEFETYNNYVEVCKQEIKKELGIV